jgi:hypothetical protein
MPFSLLNKISDHGLRKGYLFLIKMGIKTFKVSGHGLRKGYLFQIKKREENI